jgi:polyphosphate kinase
MPRNFFRRVETAFPIEDTGLKEQLSDAFDVMMADDAQSRRLLPDGTYQRLRPANPEPAVDSQQLFIEQARRLVQKAAETFVRPSSSHDFENVPEPRERGLEDDEG